MKTSLSRALADSGWALFERWLTTKVGWHGGTVTKAPRNFPSTRRCSHCGEVGPKLPLAQRTFSCRRCGFVADRDHNAAINLARYPGELPQAAPVPPKPGEAAPTPG
ncbi:MAG: transposase [Myxococcota bacterium]